MYHFATAFIAVIVATVLVSGSAEAAKMSKAETVACKAEAKAKKFSWHWGETPKIRPKLHCEDS